MRFRIKPADAGDCLALNRADAVQTDDGIRNNGLYAAAIRIDDRTADFRMLTVDERRITDFRRTLEWFRPIAANGAFHGDRQTTLMVVIGTRDDFVARIAKSSAGVHVTAQWKFGRNTLITRA